MLSKTEPRSNYAAVFMAMCLAHLTVTAVLFMIVPPQAKQATSTGIAGATLAILLFPVYLLDSLGADRDFPGYTFELLYVACWVLSAFLWAFLGTALFRYLRPKRSSVV